MLGQVLVTVNKDERLVPCIIIFNQVKCVLLHENSTVIESKDISVGHYLLGREVVRGADEGCSPT